MRNGEERRCAQIRAREHQRLCLCSSFKAQLFKFHTTKYVTLPAHTHHVRNSILIHSAYTSQKTRTNLNTAQKNLQTSLRAGLVIKRWPETLHSLQKKRQQGRGAFHILSSKAGKDLDKIRFLATGSRKFDWAPASKCPKACSASNRASNHSSRWCSTVRWHITYQKQMKSALHALHKYTSHCMGTALMFLNLDAKQSSGCPVQTTVFCRSHPKICQVALNVESLVSRIPRVPKVLNLHKTLDPT